MNEKAGPAAGGEVSLYVMDYMASLAKTNFGAHGYAANFILSVMDREWRKGLDLPQTLDIARKCIHELKTRSDRWSYVCMYVFICLWSSQIRNLSNILPDIQINVWKHVCMASTEFVLIQHYNIIFWKTATMCSNHKVYDEHVYVCMYSYM